MSMAGLIGGGIQGLLQLIGVWDQNRRDEEIKAEEQQRYDKYVGMAQSAGSRQYENLSALIKGTPGNPAYEGAAGESTPGLLELYKNLTGQAIDATNQTASRADQRLLTARDQTLAAQDEADRANINTLQGLRDATVGGYQKRMDTGMGMLEGLGRQEKADIGQRWTNAANTQQRALVGRGLSGTTAAASLASGMERQKGAELARTEERLQGQRLNTYGALSGDVLGATERMGTNVANATMTAANNRAGIMTNWAQDAASMAQNYDDQSLALRIAGDSANVQNQERLLTGLYQTDYQNTGNIIDLMASREGPYNSASPWLGAAEAWGGVNSIIMQNAAARQAASEASKARRAQAWGMGLNTGMGAAGIGAGMYNASQLANYYIPYAIDL